MEDPIATPKEISCRQRETNTVKYGYKNKNKNLKKKRKDKKDCLKLTSLSFMAKMIALACSAAFPTSGSNTTLINATGIFHAVDAPCETDEKSLKQIFNSILGNALT